MKGKYCFQVSGIVLSLLCLASCAKQDVSSSTTQPKSLLSESNNTLGPKDTSAGEKDNLLSKPGKSENQKDDISFDDVISPSRDASSNDKLLADLTQKLSHSKLAKFADSFVICTVNDIPITVGDYRHQFKSEQQEVQASITMNPEVTKNLLSLARENGVTLSLDERTRLVESAKKMQAGGTKGFNKFLADSHMTIGQFRDQIMDVGLAFKMATKAIESGLVSELVNRSLLSQAAKENGFSKDAFKKYSEISQSQEYKRLIQVGGISADDLRNEVIGNELCLRQIQKIQKDSPISDEEVSNYYEKNRGKFRHANRIRLSQIFIARGGSPTETEDDRRMKLKKENPKLSDAEINTVLDKQVKEKIKLAQDILERARKGEDFAALANQYSDDLDKSAGKNGGDLGFQDQSKLDKAFGDKLAKLGVGGITPEVIVSPYGYHIFKVTGKESPGYYKLSEIKDGLKKMLAEEKSHQVLDSWLANARQKAIIAVSPEMKNLIASNKLEKR